MSTAVIHDPYWDTLGGGERYSASVAAMLIKRGWQVTIDWPDLTLADKIQSRFGIDISRATISPKSHALSPDLLFWLSDGSLPISLARKTIIHFQFPFQNVGGKSLLNSLKSKFYTFVVNSSFTKLFIDREYGVNSNIIYPPINTDFFASSVPKTDTIIYAGRFSNLTQLKGQNYLIQAFASFYITHPGWRLVLIGGAGVGTEAQYLASLQHQVAQLPIDITTNPTADQLKSALASAKIFWSASGYGVDQNHEPLKVEHFGITVVEAMAAGCVPFVPNLGGHPEIVSSGTDGYLYTTLDQLISQTHELITHPAQLAQLSQAAIVKSKMFSIVAFESNLAKLLA